MEKIEKLLKKVHLKYSSPLKKQLLKMKNSFSSFLFLYGGILSLFILLVTLDCMRVIYVYIRT